MKHERKFREKLDKFITSGVNRQWITTPEVSCYVRLASHLRGTEIVKTLDLGSIEVPRTLQGKGIASRVVEIMQEVASRLRLVLYVENVQHSRLETHLRKLQVEDPQWQELTLQTSGVSGCWSWEKCTQVRTQPEGWDQ